VGRVNNDFEVTLPAKLEPSTVVLKQVSWHYETAEEWCYETTENIGATKLLKGHYETAGKCSFLIFHVFQVEDAQCDERESWRMEWHVSLHV